MDATRQNVRLAQLLEEVQRTFELIDEQRRKAASIIESHEQVVAQKSLENSQLQERLAELEHKVRCIASVEHLLEFSKAEVSRLTTENSSLKHELKAITKKGADLIQHKHQAMALASELAATKRDLVAANADASRVKEELSTTLKINKELRLALSSSTDQLTALLTLLLERNNLGNNHSQIEGNIDGMNSYYDITADSVDRKRLYSILSCRSTILNHAMFPSSSTAASPLSLFLLTCTLSTQQIFLRRLCALIHQGASSLSDASERLNFLASAFALSLAEDFISVLLSPEESLYFIAAETPNIDAFKAALSLSTSLQRICGDSFAVLEETLLTGVLPAHSQLKLSAPRIRGFFAQVLPVLFSSMDMLVSVDTGIHTYSSFLSAPSLIEGFIFAVTAYTYRAISFNFRRPLNALSSRFFTDAMNLLCPSHSVSARSTDQSELSVDELDCLLAVFSDHLSTDQFSSLSDLISNTRAMLSKISNTNNDSEMKERQEQILGQRQSCVDAKLLENIQAEASQQFQNLISEQGKLRAELDRTKAELTSLHDEHATTVGLLRIATDRISITDEANIALRNALSS